MRGDVRGDEVEGGEVGGDEVQGGEVGGDEVDRVVAAWRQQRPDLDLTPLHVLSRVTRLSRLLDLDRRRAFAEHDLEQGEFDVLSALRRAGAPHTLPTGALVQQTLVSSGTMTNRVDRLEARGLVERAPDPHDRRGVQVRLTPRGAQRVDAAMADLLRRERSLLVGLGERDRAHLADLLRAVLLPLDDGAPSRTDRSRG